MLTGLLGAFAAAVLYGAATVLQAAGVRHLRAVPASAPLAARLWAGRLYAVGLGLDAASGAPTGTARRRRTPAACSTVAAP